MATSSASGVVRLPSDLGSRSHFARALIPVWLVTSAWDAACATALSVYGYHSTATRLWQGVASTVLGPSALQDGAATVVAGLALHLGVALAWSTVFLAVATARPALRRAIRTPAGALAVAVAYGPIIWLVMSLVVIPLATGRPPQIGFRWWVQLGAHVPFVTIPLVFTARRVLQADEAGGAASLIA